MNDIQVVVPCVCTCEVGIPNKPKTAATIANLIRNLLLVFSVRVVGSHGAAVANLLVIPYRIDSAMCWDVVASAQPSKEIAQKTPRMDH